MSRLVSTYPFAFCVGLAAFVLPACGSDWTTASEGNEKVSTTSAALGSVLTVPADGAWHWFDKTNSTFSMECLDTSTTGIGINVPLINGNGRILILLDGGGACYDPTTCNARPPSQGFSVARTSYSQTDFINAQTYPQGAGDGNAALPFLWSKPELQRGIFDRTTAINPFQNYTFVFVPYCSGDLFAGNNPNDTVSHATGRTPSNMTFVGAVNFGNVADTLVATFPHPPSIVLSGGSAGGVGALFNYQPLRQRYNTAPLPPITVISDSGGTAWTGTPSVSDPAHTWQRQGYWLRQAEPANGVSYVEDFLADAWNLAATVPADVAAAPYNPPGSTHAIYPFQNVLISDIKASTTDRIGIISGNNDWLVPGLVYLNGPVFVGLGLPDAISTTLPTVQEGLTDLNNNVMLPNMPRTPLLIIDSTLRPNIALRQWNEHHTHILDDVSVWGAAPFGSGLATYLTSQLAIVH